MLQTPPAISWYEQSGTFHFEQIGTVPETDDKTVSFKELANNSVSESLIAYESNKQTNKKKPCNDFGFIMLSNRPGIRN